MDTNEKLALLEEMMELDKGMLLPDTVLSSIEEYDSMAKLSLIVLMKDEFDKKITVKDIKQFVKVQDILDFMG